MQQSSQKKNHLCRISAVLTLVFCLGTFIPPAFARAPAARKDFPPPLIIAMADPPDFLATPPTCKVPEREKGKAITPFIGMNRALTLLPTPERPAIAASDEGALERPEVTAGVNVNLGKLDLNLGYTVPASKVDNIVRPLGVDLESGADDKCFSLGVKIPF